MKAGGAAAADDAGGAGDVPDPGAEALSCGIRLNYKGRVAGWDRRLGAGIHCIDTNLADCKFEKKHPTTFDRNTALHFIP